MARQAEMGVHPAVLVRVSCRFAAAPRSLVLGPPQAGPQNWAAPPPDTAINPLKVYIASSTLTLSTITPCNTMRKEQEEVELRPLKHACTIHTECISGQARPLA